MNDVTERINAGARSLAAWGIPASEARRIAVLQEVLELLDYLLRVMGIVEAKRGRR